MFVLRRFRVPVRPWVLLAAVGAASFSAPGALRAQAHPGDTPTMIMDEMGRGTPVRRPQPFSLFGNQDLAFAGMHGTGNLASFMSNVGPCETGIFAQRCLRLNAGNIFQYFELGLLAAVPRGDWLKNRDKAPSLRNARGEGYSQLRNDLVFTSKMEIGPKDGTLGTLFSGATATTDGTCQDNNQRINGTLSAGLQLLASSNCTPTWPAGTWLGDHPISADNWIALFQTQGAAFTFNFARVPSSLKQLDRFMGTNFSTYGTMSDHHSGIRATYGNVIPGGVGDPTNDGWPLGLDFEFQAFNYALPTVQSVMYYQMLVINNSAQLYGVGLDYDSLYLGLTQGVAGLSPANTQTPSEYFEPQRGAAVFASNGSNINCNNALTPAGVAVCTRPAGGGLAAVGGDAVIFLRSPIGDLRNKLFTRAGSPFFMPAHPLAGDTITFNHGHACGFSACSNNTVRFSDKRGFGLLSSTEENVLDGRTPGSIVTIAGEYWLSFRSRAYPTQDGKFNKWLPPGGWDYNHDGILDTLSLESCGGATGTAFVTMANGCVATYADTMPGKQNNSIGNIGGTMGAGPIHLAAGDTATFIFAFVVEADSARLEAGINNAIDFYQSFFFGPEPPVLADITASEVDAGGDFSVVNLFYTDAPERWVDPFLTDFATKVTNAPAGTELARLRTLNPTFVATVTAAARDNLQEMEVFKSCDGGNTFTAGTGCTPDLAVDEAGNNVGVGWRAYRILRRSDFAGGDVPNVFQDVNVIGGHTYLYVLLSKTRGASFQVRDSIDTDANGLFDAIGGRVFTVAPQLLNSLSRSASDPNVVSIYVPFSSQAGTVAPQLSISGVLGGATVPFTVQFAAGVVGGQYHAVFGNNMRIVEVHHPVVKESVLVSFVTLKDSVTAYVPATGLSVKAVFDVVADTSFAPRGVPFAGTPVRTVSVNGDTTFYAFSTGALGFMLVNGSNRPMFVSTTLTGSAATPPAVFGSRDFGGFVISADNRNAGVFSAESTFQDNALIPQAIVNSYRVQWRQESAVKAAIGQGNYRVQWTGDPFGVRRGFTINFADPTQTAAALADSLLARTATPALTDSGLASILGVNPATLRPARLPFTITNIFTGRPVKVVVFTRASNTMVLGDGEDTVRVAVPAGEWVPGDRMAFIELLEEDSLGAGTAFVVLGADGRPLRVTRPRVTFTTAILGCNQPRETCNPVQPGTRGAGVAAGTGYLALTPTTVTTFHYFVGFNRFSDYVFNLTAPLTGTGITTVTGAQLDSIRVVPNPFVAFSTFQTTVADSRVVFTHMPPRGSMRIYTVSGQFVQQITWTTADLANNGDLFYNLRTREGTDLATGMYIWVLNTDVGGRQQKLGKFVVIRSRSN
jgi:hypothetical protein